MCQQFTFHVLVFHTFLAAGMENWRAFVDGASGRQQQQQHPGGRTPSAASRPGGGVGGGAGEGAAAADTSERHLI